MTLIANGSDGANGGGSSMTRVEGLSVWVRSTTLIPPLGDGARELHQQIGGHGIRPLGNVPRGRSMCVTARPLPQLFHRGDNF